MHDVDRTQLEYGSELYTELASDQPGYSGEVGSIMSSVFGEAEAAGAPRPLCESGPRRRFAIALGPSGEPFSLSRG